MKLNKQIFNLMANFFGLAAPVEKKETESNSYARKKCKSCDWYSQTQLSASGITEPRNHWIQPARNT